MHKVLPVLASFLLLCLTSSLSAQQSQSVPDLPKLGPSPGNSDPTMLNDFEPPTLVCLNGLSANLMNSGTLAIQANDLLQFVSDNVTPVDQILLGMRVAGNGTGFPLDAQSDPVVSLGFNCDDLGDTITLELWAMDAAGNAAFCSVHFILQDNLNACNPGANVLLCAKTMCGDQAIEEVTYIIGGQPNFIPPFELFWGSNITGCANLPGYLPLADYYTLKARKENNPLNGIDEQDFTLLSNHINGTQPFTEPWQWVAADVNRDGQITLEDSIELRHLLLGIYQELPNNSAWRFIPRNYQFASPDPLTQPIPETITIAELTAFMDTSFWGIKIGDLDCSSTPNFTSQSEGLRNEPGQQEKTAPPVDPTRLQGPPADVQAPTVTCLNGLNVNIMPTGMSSLWASDFVLSVTDDITPSGQIKLGIRICGTGTGFPLDSAGLPVVKVRFVCPDLGLQCVELWAMDAAGNANYCETTLLVKDELSVCNYTPPQYNVKVCKTTFMCNFEYGVEEVLYHVTVETPPDPPYEYYTNDYCIKESFPVGSNVTITPIKDDNPLNGVTTYDLILIDQHRDGTKPFLSPWQWVAADVNQDGLINHVDTAHIRDLILGIYTEFPNTTSWRFVLQGHEFPANDPLSAPFPESFHIQNLQQDSVYVASFLGIKMGDVNCTALANAEEPDPDDRTQNIAPLSIGLPYPNPTEAGARIPVHLPQPENLRLELYDLSGKLLWFNEESLDYGEQVLDIPATAMSAPGLYVWRVRAMDVVRTGKLVRQ